MLKVIFLVLLSCSCVAPTKVEIVPVELDTSCGPLIDEYRLQSEIETEYIKNKNPDILELKYSWQSWSCEGPLVGFLTAKVRMKSVSPEGCYIIVAQFSVKVFKDKEGGNVHNQINSNFVVEELSPCKE